MHRRDIGTRLQAGSTHTLLAGGQGHPRQNRAGEDELRRLAAALLGSTCVLSSCSLLPFSQAVISRASLVQEDIFFPFGKFNKLPFQHVLSHDKGVFHT